MSRLFQSLSEDNASHVLHLIDTETSLSRVRTTGTAEGTILNYIVVASLKQLIGERRDETGWSDNTE
jgi:hypothetical protein